MTRFATVPQLLGIQRLAKGGEVNLSDIKRNRSMRTVHGLNIQLFALSIVFVLGMSTAFVFWGRDTVKITAAQTEPVSSVAGSVGQAEIDEWINQMNSPGGYSLNIAFGDIGPQLLAAGAIDLDLFKSIYEQAGKPLTKNQIEILEGGSGNPVVINPENAYFLLNFFWALGLTNQNEVLTKGPMTQYGPDGVMQFASTGGWTLGNNSPAALYASLPIISLTNDQQVRLELVAAGVYRPCCNNPTLFPDCNHGMAMLGILELLASNDASINEMFEAAKYVNAFWFPEHTLKSALFLRNAEDVDFDSIDPRQITGPDFSSQIGSQQVQSWLIANDLLPQSSGERSGCGV
ncbi:MAG: hypothetical protein DWQ07_18655 [Chloroflexi bacterium]|nr:MAG: hypothetical protein DWQ07_18655 [Chloroflexota bacterium]MBL1194953.1 hypothetical protein [Chloroflexota bacterium]NOH12243.1 hypothetical protein [Chloroflexota bacterium]